MKRARKTQSSSPPSPAHSGRDANADKSQSLTPFLTAIITALVVAAVVTLPLVISEGTIAFGTNLPSTMLACVLLVGWGLVAVQRGAKGQRGEGAKREDAEHEEHVATKRAEERPPTTPASPLAPSPLRPFAPLMIAAAALIGWHTLSGLVHLSNGTGRFVWNAMWLWLGLGTIAWLIISTIVTARQVRAVVAVMISIAAVLAAVAAYQYHVSLPQMRAEFEKDRQAMVAGTDQQFQEGTQEHELLRYRVESPEPLATFALTNSLAGFLAPWIIAGLIVTVQTTRSCLAKDTQERTFYFDAARAIGLAVLVLLLLYILSLTNSKAGMLAVLIGGGLYALTNFWPLHWGRKQLAAAVLAAAAIGVCGLIVVAALDPAIWRGAHPSLLYRLEYWHSTARMIAESPLFGCGPGNFQDYYAQFKLPQASETVADPHNFLMEVAATTGVPGLLLLLAVLGGIAWFIWRQPTTETGAPTAAIPSAADHMHVWSIYAGGASGVILSWPFGILGGYGSETFLETAFPLYLVLGPPVMALTLAALHGWVLNGRWTMNDCGLVLVTLLANLLAAGSTSFPGVIITAWLIGAFVAGEQGRQRAATTTNAAPSDIRPSLVAWLTVFVGFFLVGACYFTSYNPLLQARGYTAEARYQLGRGRANQAAVAYRASAEADPWSPTSWQELATLELTVGSVIGWSRVETGFAEACNKFIERAPHSFTAWAHLGNLRLRAYRISGRDSYLEEAMLAYQRAIELYPNDGFLHAQLAWVHHLRRDDPAAKREAKEALRLDELHSHKERKLEKRKLDDVGKEFSKTAEPLPDSTAREIMERLLKEKETASPGKDK